VILRQVPAQATQRRQRAALAQQHQQKADHANVVRSLCDGCLPVHQDCSIHEVLQNTCGVVSVHVW